MEIREEDLKLREMTEADIPTIVEIEQELFSLPWTTDIFLEEIASRDQFYQVINGKKLTCKHNYLLELRGEIVGFFLGWAIYGEYSLMNIGVTKRYQNLGLGSFLLHQVIEKALELECFDIYLEVRESNISAQKLYRKYGFKEISIRKDYYFEPTENALVMRLDLDVSGEKMDALLDEILRV
ncbi:ribosomal protein S18-alanine N-acetyltransferase [bacterium]|nr:ribosomal protein S18-alanine N-acetyltransferase [bacterium]